MLSDELKYPVNFISDLMQHGAAEDAATFNDPRSLEKVNDISGYESGDAAASAAAYDVHLKRKAIITGAEQRNRIRLNGQALLYKMYVELGIIRR